MLESVITLAQDGSGGGAAAGIIAAVFVLFYIALIVVVVIGAWKMFVKAGQPGWGCLVPILNIYFLTKIAGRPGWWVLLFFVPIANIVVAIILMNDLSKSFGRGIGTTLGLIFLNAIFVCILGYGSAQYQGPAVSAR